MKKSYVLIGLGAGIIGGAVAIAAKREKTEIGFEWISAKNEPNPTTPADEADGPMFWIGDKVNVHNPYLGGLEIEPFTNEPAFYEVLDYRYDGDDNMYRFLLDTDEIDWVAETWLTLPWEAEFSKSFRAEFYEEEPTSEMVEAERKLLSKAMDDSVNQNEIDALLGIVQTGTDEERAWAKDKLRELIE